MAVSSQVISELQDCPLYGKGFLFYGSISGFCRRELATDIDDGMLFTCLDLGQHRLYSYIEYVCTMKGEL